MTEGSSMAIAAFIIVGVLLVGSTVLASFLLLQRRTDAGLGQDARRINESEEDEYSQRLRKTLRSRLSHELRTPLNSIITLSQIMIEDEHAPLSVEQRRYLEVIRRNGRSL